MSSLPTYGILKHFLVTWPAPFVSHVEINRPSKMNAFIPDMWLELRLVFQALSADVDVRVVVLSGAGDGAFTAGLDLRAASQNPVLQGGEGVDVARKAAYIRRYVEEFQDCISAVERCQKPVICVLHGISYGLAIDLSCAADIRICSKDTRFSVKEVDIGLAADIGTLSRLPKAVGSSSWVKEVCLSAREFGAAEALNVGFVSQVHDAKATAVDAALSMAGLMASKSPVAVQGTKEILNHARDNSVTDSMLKALPEELLGLQCLAVSVLPRETTIDTEQVCDTRLSGMPQTSRQTTYGRPLSQAPRRPGPPLKNYRDIGMIGWS